MARWKVVSFVLNAITLFIVLKILQIVELWASSESDGSKEEVIGAIRPSWHIACFRELTQPLLDHLQDIEDSRRILNHTDGDFSWVHGGWKKPAIYQFQPGYFNRIDNYRHIKTLLLNATEDEIKKCMLKDYYPSTVVTHHKNITGIAKRHTNFRQPIYGMTYNEDFSHAFNQSPLNEEVFDVGLPPRFAHGVNKTISFIHVISDGCLTAEGDAITVGVNIIPGRCYAGRHAQLERRPWPVVASVFTISRFFGNGIFHGNVEGLSRLSLYLPFLIRNPQIKIHVQGNIPVFTKMLPIEPSRFVSGFVCASTAYVPAGSECCIPNAITTQLLGFRLRHSLPNPSDRSIRNVIVLIKRSKRRNRYFIHHADILRMLKTQADRHAMSVWEFTDDPLPTFSLTAEIFNRAVLVVAPHGAGEANLLVSQPNTVLIEALCIDQEDGLVNLVYRSLVYAMGGRYFGHFNPQKHCTETSAADLQPLVEYVLHRLATGDGA